MAVHEKDGKRIYRTLLEQGIPQDEIDRVYRKLRDKGYGKEDTDRHFREAAQRLRERRKREEQARRGRRRHRETADADAAVDEISAESSEDAAPAPDGRTGNGEDLHRRAEDSLPRVPFHLRWTINRWAYRHGLKITGLPERISDFLAFFFPARQDCISDDLVRFLCIRSGFSIEQPLENSLRDTLDALSGSARLFLGGKRGARTYQQREKAQRTEQEIRGAWSRREPFGLAFLSRFAVPGDQLERGLAYLELAWRNRQRVEVSGLARIVRDLYRLILGTEQVEYGKIIEILAVGRDIGLAYDKSSRMHERLTEAENLFLQAYRHLHTFRTELYPALLKMIGCFFEFESESEEKTKRIHEVLELRPEDILSYRSYLEQAGKAEGGTAAHAGTG